MVLEERGGRSSERAVEVMTFARHPWPAQRGAPRFFLAPTSAQQCLVIRRALHALLRRPSALHTTHTWRRDFSSSSPLKRARLNSLSSEAGRGGSGASGGYGRAAAAA